MAEAIADVAIIGGGIIGCSAAYELSRRGLSVTLIERDELAAGASGRNHGLLVTPLDPALTRMAERSTALYRRAVGESELPVPFDERPMGFLIVAGEEESEREAARAEAEAAASNGVGIERLSGDEARKIEPALSPTIDDAWLLDDALRVDPAALTVALALRASATGATIHRHLTARAVRMEGGRANGVITDAGIIGAEAVVLAAGPWTPSLLRKTDLDDRSRPVLAIQSFRGWLVHLAPDRSLLHRLVGRAGWHTLPGSDAIVQVTARDVVDAAMPEPPGTLLQPNADGTLLAGGSRHAAVTNEPEDPSMPRRILRAATSIVPDIGRAVVIAAWWGLRPMTRSGRPIVAEVAPRLFVASGHGSQGVILGGGTAELVAALVTGTEAPFDPSPFGLQL